MPEAPGAVFPVTTLQTSRASDPHQPGPRQWKDRNALAAAIKPIYMTVSPEAAEAAEGELDAFDVGPMGAEIPHRHGRLAQGLEQGPPVLRLPARWATRGYTSNAIESVNTRLRKVIKTHGHSHATTWPPS